MLPHFITILWHSPLKITPAFELDPDAALTQPCPDFHVVGDITMVLSVK